MNSKKAKVIRRSIENFVPLSNILGKNIYRNVKRDLTHNKIPMSIDQYTNRYEELHKRMDNAKKNKWDARGDYI